jgi:hypothetical protein
MALNDYKYANPDDKFSARINDYEERIARLERLIGENNAWIPFVPRLLVGGVAGTVNTNCAYHRGVDRVIHARYAIRAVSYGGGQYDLDLPFPMKSPPTSPFDKQWANPIGICGYNQSTGNGYSGLCFHDTDSLFFMATPRIDGLNHASWGNGTPVAAAGGDIIWANITYEGAT